MPDIHPAFEYLVGHFFMAGAATPTGQGLIALDWQKIHFFRIENELDLDVWERGILVKMSEAYVNEYYAATDPSRQAPNKKLEKTSAVQIAQSMNFRSIIRAAGKKQ